ncbi:YihY/virulence factor BrkB family protein [Halomicrobium salinisoli]|uniref:YihY/virulence factor BrkB family protein n=1 Tax=Halomicrobium salinisoli TaxID=2878391 RepID=UPI001CF0CB4E|nr:YhjD/YihY/BrkB family envelope integrity protein [Halomicrobium salinisoli]
MLPSRIARSGRLGDAVEFALTVVRSVNDHELRYPAAAFAYYAFVSFLPLLVLAVALLGEAATAQLQSVTPRLLTPAAQELVRDSLTTASGRVGATALAVVALAWAGANVAVDFQTVVERVEGWEEAPLTEQLRDAVEILILMGLPVASIALAGVLAVPLAEIPGAVFGWSFALLVALTAAFLPLYYVSSHVVTTPRGALPGAVVAAVGWTALLTGIRFYAVNATQYALYGVLSGVIIILTSLYLASLILMSGVVVNAVAADGEEAPSER